jgi:hypothetical protein
MPTPNSFRALLLAVMLVAGSMIQPSVRAAETPIATADFTKDGAGWAFYGHKTIESADAKLGVGDIGKYHGGLLLLTAPLRIPQATGQGLHIQLTLGGFSDISGGADTVCSGRFFLAPKPLPSFPEPYALTNAFVIMFNYSGADKPAAISLFSKVNGKAGFGDMLYQGTFDASQFPVTMDLNITKDTYRVKFDKTVTSGAGARSGYHNLPPAQWSGDLAFGGRIVNEDDTHDSQMTLDALSAFTTQAQPGH